MGIESEWRRMKKAWCEFISFKRLTIKFRLLIFLSDFHTYTRMCQWRSKKINFAFLKVDAGSDFSKASINFLPVFFSNNHQLAL